MAHSVMKLGQSAASVLDVSTRLILIEYIGASHLKKHIARMLTTFDVGIFWRHLLGPLEVV